MEQQSPDLSPISPGAKDVTSSTSAIKACSWPWLVVGTLGQVVSEDSLQPTAGLLNAGDREEGVQLRRQSPGFHFSSVCPPSKPQTGSVHLLSIILCVHLRLWAKCAKQNKKQWMIELIKKKNSPNKKYEYYNRIPNVSFSGSQGICWFSSATYRLMLAISLGALCPQPTLIYGAECIQGDIHLGESSFPKIIIFIFFPFPSPAETTLLSPTDSVLFIWGERKATVACFTWSEMIRLFCG